MNLVFFLEERSAKVMLEGILPKLLRENITPYLFDFDGKQDLEKQLVRKMKLWNRPGESRFIVLRDQDAGDCRTIKRNLLDKCQEAGRPDAIVRIACHELESFYLGDLRAVEQGLDLKGLAKMQDQRQYRDPDNFPSPAKKLSMLTKCYEKVSGSRAIGRYLNVDSNCSRSFNVLVKAIKDIVSSNPIL